MEGAPRLTQGAVREIWELPDGPGTIKPVLQVADLRPVTTKNHVGHQSERYRMLLSDGVHSQQSMLATAHNHLDKTGALRLGSVVHLHDITCNTIQTRRSARLPPLDFPPPDKDWILARFLPPVRFAGALKPGHILL
ncbi:hypothetical protein ZWY2020_054449 [Hordeum vulgare]|nr:hypothetical protein ZWY2020_054449 [Hordeum vulgare]